MKKIVTTFLLLITLRTQYLYIFSQFKEALNIICNEKKIRRCPSGEKTKIKSYFLSRQLNFEILQFRLLFNMFYVTWYKKFFS